MIMFLDSMTVIGLIVTFVVVVFMFFVDVACFGHF